MSENPLDGYSDAQALRLLWDMAAGVRQDLAEARQRIQELEQQLQRVPVIDSVKQVLFETLTENEALHQRVAELERENEQLRGKVTELLSGDIEPGHVLVDAVRELYDGSLSDGLELAGRRQYWAALDLVRNWLYEIKRQQ